jgi:hypothetical protein
MFTKYYSDLFFLPPGRPHLSLLYPFWGALPEPKLAPDSGRLEALTKYGSQFYHVSPEVKSAKAGILPFAFLHTEECWHFARRMAEVCQKADIPMLLFNNADDISPINLQNTIVLRTSALASKCDQQVVGLPTWSADFARYYPNEEIQYAAYQKKPSVSYCGYIDYLQPFDHVGTRLKRTVSYWFGKRSRYQDQGLILRGQAIRILLADPTIHTNLILREGFWGGKRSPIEARVEYAGNMQESPYALTVRGAGNFSYRLYEVMSSGRIPVFINTDCLLPFSDWIDWKKQMVWIEATERQRLPEIIKSFHAGHNADSLLALQKQNRAIYEEWLSPLGFARNLYRILDRT